MTERSESERAEEDRIDRLRLAAFKSNDASDRQSYFDAASKWFQDRHYRRLAAQDQKPLWIYEDDLPDGYPYDAMFDRSEIRNGVRMFPVYLSPPPAAGWDEAMREIISAVLFAKWSGEAKGWPEGEWSAPDWGAWRNRTKLNPVGLSRTAFEEEADFLLKEVQSAALSKPAPVAANASAEARLREAFLSWIDKRIENTILNQRNAYASGNDALGSRYHAAQCELLAVKSKFEALSAHPHASDCDKQGER